MVLGTGQMNTVQSDRENCEAIPGNLLGVIMLLAGTTVNNSRTK